MNPADYKKLVASRYLPVDASLLSAKLIESDYYLCSSKIDGHLGVLEVGEGKATLYDRSGNELDVPSILQAASSINGSYVFAGEICLNEKGKACRNHDVASALADPASKGLNFAVFDLVLENGSPPADDIKERYERLKKIVSNREGVFAVEQHVFTSRKDVAEFYNQAIQDYEGIVVRCPGGLVYKVKPVITLDLVVLGYAEGVGERQGVVRDLLLGCALGDNRYLVIGACGNGLSEEQRSDFYQKLSTATVNSDYLEVSGAKTAFAMVRPDIVIELSCVDVIAETSTGIIRKAELSYDPECGYTRSGALASVSLISPVFLRIRSDKTATAADAGLKQIDPYLTKAAAEADAVLASSEVITRECFTKEGKGGLAIRKFVALKTNKESSGLFSPYVVVYSDFSGGRKTPLEQEIFLCTSEETARQKIMELKAENIKKGWSPVS